MAGLEHTTLIEHYNGSMEPARLTVMLVISGVFIVIVVFAVLFMLVIFVMQGGGGGLTDQLSPFQTLIYSYLILVKLRFCVGISH